jgi:CheY-like chemotaxis protein
VLVVDDNETNRHVLAMHLATAGYDVALASSGREALVTMRLALGIARPFDVVLSDFQMPEMDGAMLGEAINSDPELARSRVVLLTSIDKRGSIERFASLGFAGYLTKPIRARELCACLRRVVAREAREWHERTHPVVTESSASSGPASKPFAGKVLLVEDNVVNQKVGQRFLERLGCEVRIAENGEESLRLYQEERFAVILMDIQMPVMDGYTATRRIRELEGARARTPIIALTADAMTGQLERCLQSGMDGLLTKPLDPQRLQDALERFGLGSAEEALNEAIVERMLRG